MMAEREGLASSTIAGIGAIVIAVIILLVVVSTLDNAQLMKSTALTSATENGLCINGSSGTYACGKLTLFDSRNRDFSITAVVNDTASFPIANYTFNSATGRFANTTKSAYNLVNVTFNYRAYTTYETTFADTKDNMTSGFSNVATKLPTILLIVAVILLLGILILLVVKAREVSSNLGGGGSSLGNFKGSSSSVGGEGPAGSL